MLVLLRWCHLRFYGYLYCQDGMRPKWIFGLEIEGANPCGWPRLRCKDTIKQVLVKKGTYKAELTTSRAACVFLLNFPFLLSNEGCLKENTHLKLTLAQIVRCRFNNSMPGGLETHSTFAL